MPFWPGLGVARGKAAASLGDKKSRAASGHILNSSIVRQEEACLVNVAVTTLKHPNLILTTSLRRRRSDKHEELRRDEATAALGSREPCPADTRPNPAHRRTREIEQISGLESNRASSWWDVARV